MSLFQCLFCRHWFNELAFWGCCADCYCSSKETRAIVDQAHPQTDSRSINQESEVR